ncbi:hypothetical protein GCM10010411_52920 [Actinomadura fulvescens]|uniref:Uncharacterized protein n=1 Tax=Actinomadura fulvescens TaxID=46160 RepID=A0ABN3Q3I4_9ACTN
MASDAYSACLFQAQLAAQRLPGPAPAIAPRSTPHTGDGSRRPLPPRPAGSLTI